MMNNTFRIQDYFKQFVRSESAGGICLMIAAILAIIIANSSLYGLYEYVLSGLKLSVGVHDPENMFDLQIKKPVLLWINDGLMAVFFLLVGLEVKRELTEGHLSNVSQAILPAIGAIGGIVLPAGLFWAVNYNHPDNMSGWAIPVATDIAFALGVLSLLGNRVPVQIKILLAAIAVTDDIAAILIIALFYSHGLLITPFYFAFAALIGLFVLNRRNVISAAPYILIGMVLWVSLLEAGIHATLAGVITALFVPMRDKKNPAYSPCIQLEHSLHPWISFLILPLFAFANAGVPFAGMGLHSFAEPLTLGIILGLLVGKPLGIYTALYLSIKSGLAKLPEGATWRQIFAISILCGIGFTMSLFIGGLAFETIDKQASIRLGILTASALSAIAGYLLLAKGKKAV